jgi:hypothetical protein
MLAEVVGNTFTFIRSAGFKRVIYWDRGDTRWRSWLRYCTTSRKVTGSIPDDVIGVD